ncbi:polyhydroxybutyrate depolymerase [Nocardioides thalensis]|uniref:Polyhydroxybutyrate depolymerase n=1 Tax=Nocardioides thalensis TaxID=1914755 RepID=A0A853C1P5_9ACTN|nr:polyhydroxybutyrate depolymerase [Nocardioides thalensis]
MRWLWVIGLLLVVACSPDEEVGSGGESGPTASPSSAVATEAAEDDLLLHVPPGGEGKRPLVLLFHGTPGAPEQLAQDTRFNRLADEEGFVVAYPDPYLEIGALRDLIDRLVAEEGVDPRRVYAGGFSRGASLVYDLAVRLPDRIAAFAPVSGLPPSDFSPRRAVPLITFQGGRDNLAAGFPSTNRTWAKAAGCEQPEVAEIRMYGGPARRSIAQCDDGAVHAVYELPRMGHEWPREATGLIWEFFEAHRLGG